MSWFTSEDLISRIEENPVLWDKSQGEYKDNRKADDVWMGIAASLYQGDWEGLKYKAKDSKIADLKRRWRSIRDNFNREVGKQKEEARSGKYKFTEMLAFLRPSQESGPTEDSLADEDSSSIQLSGTDTDHTVETTDSGIDPSPDFPTSLEISSQPPSQSTSQSTITTGRCRSQGRGKMPKKKDYEQNILSSLQTFVTVYQNKAEEKKQRAADNSKDKSSNVQFLLSLESLLDLVPAQQLIPCRRALLNTVEYYASVQPEVPPYTPPHSVQHAHAPSLQGPHGHFRLPYYGQYIPPSSPPPVPLYDRLLHPIRPFTTTSTPGRRPDPGSAATEGADIPEYTSLHPLSRQTPTRGQSVSNESTSSLLEDLLG